MDDQTEKDQKKKQRIGTPEAAALLFIALLFDIISLIPYTNTATVWAAQGLLAIFFLIHGVNIFKGGYKKALTYIIAFIIEAIPFASMFPAITFETLIIIAISRVEDKTGIKIESKPKLPSPKT